MESKELMTVDFSSSEVVKTLKETVAQGLTNSEFALFAEHCKSTKLNPFKKEVWAIKAGGRLQLMTGINGYFTIANSHPDYDGYEEGFIGKNGEELPDTYTGSDFAGAWCKVYRKDRRMPAKGVAFRNEYDKGHGNWKTMPKVMLLKCAESVALRKAFPQELNGIYTAEEMPKEFDLKDDKNGTQATVIDVQVQPVAEMPLEVSSQDEPWTGNFPLGFGKHAKENWCDVNANYLEWLYQNAKGDKAVNAGIEIARREQAQQPDFEAINKAANDFDKDEIPEFDN